MSTHEEKSTMHMSDAAEDVYAALAYKTKHSRAGLLAIMVDDALEEALRTMSQEDYEGLRRRMVKLFLAQFKTPEMDRAVRERVVAHAHESAGRMIEDFTPKMTESIRKYLDENWEDVAVSAAQNALKDALVMVANVFVKGIGTLMAETPACAMKKEGT